MERLILDATVLIAAERASASTDEVMGDDDDVAMAAVTVAELLVGVQLADSGHQATRRRYVNALIDTIPIEPYDLEVARTHAALLAHAHEEGRPGARTTCSSRPRRAEAAEPSSPRTPRASPTCLRLTSGCSRRRASCEIIAVCSSR